MRSLHVSEMKVEPWTPPERQTIYTSCKGGETGFDKGNLRWEATVQMLEQKLKESLDRESLLQKTVDQLSGGAGRCLHYVSQGLRQPTGPKPMKKALNRIAAELRRVTAKPDGTKT